MRPAAVPLTVVEGYLGKREIPVATGGAVRQKEKMGKICDSVCMC